MPRKALGKTRFVVSFPPDLLKRLDVIAKAAHQTRSDVVEEAVEVHVGREDRKQVKGKAGK